MARKENQMMMNNNIQTTLSMSQFEEQLLQLKEKIESQSFPRHSIVAAFEQLRTSAKIFFAHRQHNNLHCSTINNNTNNVYEIDQHLLKLFQEISQQVAVMQQQQQHQPEIGTPGTVPSLSAQKQVISNSANKYSFQNSFWEGDRISFDSGSTLSYFHDEGKNETCDENQCQAYDDEDQSSDNYRQRLNSSGNSCNIQNTQINSQNNTNQVNFFQNQFFQSINQPIQQQSKRKNQENESCHDKKYSLHESIINPNLLTPFAKLPEDNNSNQEQNNHVSKERVLNSFEEQYVDEFEEDNSNQNNIQQPQNLKSNSQNSLQGMMTSNNIGASSITNVRKGKKANLMHNIKNQLKKTNCCNYDTNDDEDEEEDEYEEYKNYLNNNSDNEEFIQDKNSLSHEKSEFKLEKEEIQKGQNFMKKSNQVSFNQQQNLFQPNQFDYRLFDQHNQKISFPIERGFDAEQQEEGDSDELDNAFNFRQFEYKQNTRKSETITQNNTPKAIQLIQLQQQKQQFNQNINFEAEEDDNDYDEEFEEGYDEEDETYNTNLDVVGQRESFQEGERLSFMASQRIHYYKMDDFSEILNERNPTFEQHCENMRNIIMTMSNNYGGLIMFGLGKNKSVQGIGLNAKEKQEFIKFITNIKNSIHNSKSLFCKVSYFPIYRLNQSHTAQINSALIQQKDNTQSPFNYQNIKPEAPTLNTTSHFKLFDQAPPADFSLFSDNPNPTSINTTYPPLLLFDSDSQTEQDLLFTPFCSQVDPKKKIFQTNNGANAYLFGGSDTNKLCNTFESNWQVQQSSNWALETNQGSKRKGSGDTKQWIPDRYIIRVFIDQGQKLDSTYVYIKNKEITSAIYDKKLKIFKPIYGEPLLNKILSKAQNPSIQAQKLSLSEPDKEGLAISQPFPQQLISQTQQQQIQPPFTIPQEIQFNQQNYNPFIGLSIPLQNQIKQSQNMTPIGQLNPSIVINNSKTDKNELQIENEEITSLLGEALRNEDIQKECIRSTSPPLTQEYIKRKRGQKIINDTKKRQIKEKNQRYSQGEEKIQARKSQQNLSNSSKSNSRESCTTLSDEFKVIPVIKYYLIEFIGFEHSDNAKAFRAQIEKQIGPCLVECGIAKYDSLFFKVNESLQMPPNVKETNDNPLNKKLNQNIINNNNNSFLSIGNFNNSFGGSNNNSVTGYFNPNSNNNLSFIERQYEWMEKLQNYLMIGDNWKCLISKDRIFKKLVIDGNEFFTDESTQWLCFQNVKNKNNFTSQIASLQQKYVIERVNLYHQHVFKINKSKEFEKFCATNKLFQQCFLSDVIKKGYSTSNIIVKSLKNTHRAQESFKQLLNNFKFTITSQGSNFFVCLFQSPLESFLAMERLINHRKQKFILDLFTSNALDAVIELQDNTHLYQQQQQQIHQQ